MLPKRGRIKVNQRQINYSSSIKLSSTKNEGSRNKECSSRNCKSSRNSLTQEEQEVVKALAMQR